MDGATGEKTALVEALAQGEVLDFEESEQLGLCASPRTREGEHKQRVKRGLGRPVGARNRRTIEMVELLLSRHRNPRKVLVEIVEAQVADLTVLLDCSLHEALVEKPFAAAAVLPYIAPRQPLAIDISNRNPVYLTIIDSEPAPADSDAGSLSRPVWSTRTASRSCPSTRPTIRETRDWRMVRAGAAPRPVLRRPGAPRGRPFPCVPLSRLGRRVVSLVSHRSADRSIWRKERVETAR